jgi:hypothetical protein
MTGKKGVFSFAVRLRSHHAAAAWVRIPGDADQRSELMSITIPK